MGRTYNHTGPVGTQISSTSTLKGGLRKHTILGVLPNLDVAHFGNVGRQREQGLIMTSCLNPFGKPLHVRINAVNEAVSSKNQPACVRTSRQRSSALT